MTELTDLFADLPEDIQAGIRDLGWSEPTPVQAKTLPLMRAEGDLIVQARTGSGKTGAFGIPIVERVDVDLAATQALIMLPTRELANQVATEVTAIGKHRGVRVLPVYGGVGYGAQLEGLERGAHVVVGTPGRVLDHLNAGRMKLDRVRMLELKRSMVRKYYLRPGYLLRRLLAVRTWHELKGQVREGFALLAKNS